MALRGRSAFDVGPGSIRTWFDPLFCPPSDACGTRRRGGSRILLLAGRIVR